MDPEKPRGRAALKAEAKQRLLQRPGPDTEAAPAPAAAVLQSSPPKEEEPPKPVGRAKLLEKLKRARELASKKTAVETGPSDVTTVEKKLEKTHIAPPEVEEKTIVKELGTGGRPLNITANYIKLLTNSDRAIFEYDVKFSPDCDAKNVRFKLINANIQALGGVKMFDGGSCLYLPIKLPDLETVFKSPHPFEENVIVNVRIIFKKLRKYGDPITIRALNLFFKRIMSLLKMQRVGQQYYDTVQTKLVPQYQLEILPGYVTAVAEYDGGLMLCLDASHRVLRTLTALEQIHDIFKTCKMDYKEAVQSTLIGQVVMTKYNNKTYIVDDILWELTPEHTFPMSTGKDISFIEYYKNQYGIEVHNLNQPLLLHVEQKKISGSEKKQEFKICLVPELCYLTGITDTMRRDNRLMKEVGSYTRLTPAKRLESLRTYVENVNKSPEAKKVLSDWGLTLANATIDLNARVLDNTVICLGGNVTCDGNVDWGNKIAKTRLIKPVDIESWIVVHSPRSQQHAQEFADGICSFAKSFGCRIARPKLCATRSERTNDYRLGIEENLHSKVECVAIVVSTSRDDLYNMIKTITLCNKGIISQVIRVDTLRRPKNLRAILLKVALQIIAKLGGSLWSLKLPTVTNNWMICGIDTYHKVAKKQSVGALVCSIDHLHTRYHTSLSFQAHEIADSLRCGFSNALEARKYESGMYPSMVVIIRDGVGDGQLQHVKDYEIPQYAAELKEKAPDSKLCFIVVQKRINTRIIKRAGNMYDNPPPGTIVDHTITKRNYNSFYLVPQSVNQGTVTPSHYIVLENDPEFTMDRIQKLCYKLCFLYYNWSGSIRVPGPCQYAHKAAYLAGENMGKDAKENLSRQLYYL